MIISLSAYTQEAIMGLYQYHPLSVNPSYTGSFDGDWRLALGFRDQQVITSESYRTAIAGFDGHFYITNQKFGIGVYFMNDVSGAGELSFNKIYGSLAYEKDIKNHIIGIGFQAGFVSAGFNDWLIWHDPTGDFTAPSGEVFSGNANYPDFNLGLSWKKKINKFIPAVGLSFQHINNPDISLTNYESKQGLQEMLDIRSDIELTGNFVITPSVLARIQQNQFRTISGVDLNLKFGTKKIVRSVSCGAYLNNGMMYDASSVLLKLGTRVKNFDIGFGYERNLSSYGQAAGTTGAYEIALIYKSISTLLNTYSIPCERF